MEIKSHFKGLARSKSLPLILITTAVILTFYILDNNFLHRDSIRNIMNAMSFVGILTVGMAMLLIGGEVDLSIGAIAGLGGIVVALLSNAGVPWLLAFLLVMLFGALCGALSALLVNVLGFVHFIATLGLMLVYQGLILVITQNMMIVILDDAFTAIGSITLFGTLIPLPFAIMIILMVMYSIFLTKVNFGRSVYMVGGNRGAARLCGINPKKISTALYINGGVLSALSGALFASRMSIASPIVGQAGALDAITAAVIGGVAFRGGAGGMGGCFIGILMINAFNAGLLTVGFPPYWQIVARGILLVLALWLDFIVTRSRERTLERAIEDV